MVIELPENKACLHLFRADAVRQLEPGMPDRGAMMVESTESRPVRMPDRTRGWPISFATTRADPAKAARRELRAMRHRAPQQHPAALLGQRPAIV
jgi:hypothetical protein